MERLYLTAIEIRAGLITLIEDDGSIGYYLQRGIGRLTDREKMGLVYSGHLVKDFKNYKELPRNYSIEFEDREIMGRALATHPYVLLKNKQNAHFKSLAKPYRK